MRATGRCGCVMFLLLWAAGISAAPQAGQVDSRAARAGAAYEAKDWAEAAGLYGELAKAPGAPPRMWFRLGVALRSLGRNEEALQAFEHATESGAPFFGEFGKATVYASRNETDKAFAALGSATAQGFAQVDMLLSEATFSEIKNDPRFAKVLDQARKNQRPCAYTQENRQFDFWVGEWSVTTTQGGVPAGDSKIELILEDCVVLENWKTSGGPYSGKSYNVYNAALKRWEQYWVDNVGGNIFFHGELAKDGVMDYWTDDIPQPNGPALRRHLQFIPSGPDTVRQYSRGSTDGGKTWTVEYDFTYARKK